MRLLRLTVPVLAAAALALTPVAAYADAEWHGDPAGDVRQIDLDTGALTPAPDQRQGDITSIRVSHGPARVKIRLTFRRLDADGSFNNTVFRIRTPHGGAQVMVLAFPHALTGTHVFRWSRGGSKCRGLRHHLEYDREALSIVVPRSCLRDPRWVQVGAGTALVEDTTTQPRLYVDDARSASVDDETLVLGPRVFRTAPASATDS